MSAALRRGAVLASLIAAAISCRPGDDVSHAAASRALEAEDTSSAHADARPGGQVRFAFHSSPELRPEFDTIFDALMERRRAAPELSEATLHRFTLDSAEQRYVLLARLIASEGMPLRQWGWAFIAIERDGARWHLSSAYDFKAEENLTITGIQDIDRDGMAEVLYCAWYEGQDELVSARALGYRNRRWYPVDLGSPVADVDCRSASEGSPGAEPGNSGTGSLR